ncbi:MAG: LysM peptidoglycan-binding domain-containing protein [Spirochaetaceae bacterium]|nr:LysM peptidoglycan-binding domain-containing protein [Spirochaetaceae bacterium]
MGKKIGIKLADGSFYPIMEDGVPQKKLMELTTVQDNQTAASIDLYRSELGTMEDAEYVDTLEISELVPHPGGEASMSFTIQLDENNMLSAEVLDPESGKTSATKADLINLPSEKRNSVPDYTLSEISDDDFDEPPLPEAPATWSEDAEAEADGFDDSLTAEDVEASESSSLDVNSFDMSDFDLDDFAAVDDSHVDALLGNDDTLVANDFVKEPVQEETTSFDLPDFGETTQDEPTSFDLPDFGETAQEEPTSFDLPDFGETAQEEPTSFDLPDFGETAQEEPTSFDLPDFGETAQEELTSFDLPDFNFGNEATAFASNESQLSEDNYLGDGADTVYEDSLPDFSKFELPDFDEPLKNDFSFGEESGLFTENDFKDPAFYMNETTSSSNPFDFSDLYDEREDELKQQENSKRRSGISVVICIICALVCVGILLFILFLLPSKTINNFISSESSVASTEVHSSTGESLVEPDETAAVEDVIVIVETPSVTPAPPPQVAKKTDVVRYEVKWGDTLWDIAQSYYNNPWLYQRIVSANNIKNPDYIVAGTVLVIPPQ